MAADLHLVLNNRNNSNLVYDDRVHLLEHTNFENKQWVCNRVLYTNLEANTVLRSTPHANTCTADDSVSYEIEKETHINATQGKKQNRCRKYMAKNVVVHRPTWKLLVSSGMRQSIKA
ncbi:hypothetical protein T01_9857 [Trichinella spiralis]|uniref:FLYWCH-type domain-containing protein n=1 Tax=Trichinella spiralis TaxID=6334 RepID=A0A0V1C0Y1_TRISP|nr:hypothetical protein T01_9857 [Trichinella spiralis]